jgi:hypothetical protein
VPGAPAPAPPVASTATPVEAVLVLQRTRGNRAVARRLARSPQVVDPKAAPAPRTHQPWAEQTTYPNLALAQEIDAYEKLSPNALADLKDQMLVQASRVGDPHHQEFERKLEALEFLASQGLVQQRQYIPPPFLDTQTDTRRIVRRNLEGYVRRGGSFSEAVLDLNNWAFQHDLFDSWNPHVDFIEKEVDAFGENFKHQARDVAQKMLHDSRNEILVVLESYGLKSDWALFHARRIANGKDADDEIDTLVHYGDAWDQPDKRTPTYSPRRHRAGLGRLITELKEQQEAVKAARLRSFNDPVGMATTEKLIDARHRLTRLWAYVEAQHPVLAAYRGDRELADADLGRLDDTLKGSEPQMTSMLKTVLPKLADILTVSWQIDHNRVNPLTLPPVVALTKAVMFVPEGSLRWGMVNDLVEAAQDKPVSKKILEGLLALIVLATLIPSGGTSLGIGIGIVSAALSASSAMEDWQDYKQHKMLANTAMDRAKALSLEEPSLLAFAFDLITLGLDGLPLIKAFHQAMTLKSLVIAGEDAASKQAINELRDELNNLGKTKGRPHLGDQALEDARASNRAAATEHEGSGSAKSETTPKKTEAAPPKEKLPPGKAPRVRVALTKEGEELLKNYSSRADLVKAIEKRLATAGTARPIGWGRAFEALRANPSRINRKIIEKLDRVMSSLQSPKLYAEVLGDAWEMVKRQEAADINAALKAMAEASGLKVTTVDAVKEGGTFFREVVSKRRYWLDPKLGGEAHGEYTHLLQDLVVDRALGGPGKSAEFRELLGQARGKIERYANTATEAPSRWILDDEGNELKNSLFVDTQDQLGNITSKETTMTTGDYVWRWTYDLFYRQFKAYGRLPQPEVLRPTLNELFLGLK